MTRLWLCLGAANGFIAVALGAFAAHGLEGDAGARGWLETGADYQLVHALALLALAALSCRVEDAARRWLTVAGWSFLAGIVLFSGGLYLMALAGIASLGPVVPMGGFAFFAGWAALFVAGWRYREDR